MPKVVATAPPRGPISYARVALKMAQNYAADNITKLTPVECEALEMTCRNFHRLERLFKPTGRA